MHVALEVGEALPGRLDRVLAGPGHVLGGLGQLQLGDVARAIGEDGARLDAHDQLRPDRVAPAAGPRARPSRRAVDAQAPRLLVHVDEQQADVGIDEQIAQALEHAVAVVVREGQLVRRRSRARSRARRP